MAFRGGVGGHYRPVRGTRRCNPSTSAGVRLFSGYAGWAPDQLEAELAEGAWFVLDAVAADVFCVDAERLWHDVMRRQGGELSLLADASPAALAQLTWRVRLTCRTVRARPDTTLR